VRPTEELRTYIGMAASVLQRGALLSPPILAAPRSPEDTWVRRFVVGRNFTDKQRVDHLKALVRLAAKQYMLPLPRLAVRFSDMTQAAGRIRRSGGTWYIDLARDFRNDDCQVLSTVAHEMAHVVLLSAGVALPTTEKNERLTDTTAALAGFGYLMQLAKRAVRQEKLRFGLTRDVHVNVGYLDQHELWQVGTVRETIRKRKRARLYGTLLPAERISCWSCGTSLEPHPLIGVSVLPCLVCGMLHQVKVSASLPPTLGDALGRWLDRRRGLTLVGRS
jgi:hypothetical protein